MDKTTGSDTQILLKENEIEMALTVEIHML